MKNTAKQHYLRNAQNTDTGDCSRDGSALITVVIIVGVISIMTSGFYIYAANMSHQVRRMSDQLHAQAIAEAGATYAVSQLQKDFSSRNSSTVFGPRNFGGGQYRFQITENGTRVVSIGSYNTTEVGVGVSLRLNRPHPYLDHSIISDGILRFNGTPMVLDGSVHSNSGWVLSGNEDNITGQISAPDYTGAHMPPPPWMFQVMDIPLLSDPEFQDLMAAADADGKLIIDNGNQRIQHTVNVDGIHIIRGDLTVRGGGLLNIDGILYVEGNVTLNGSAELNLTGTIISLGNVTLNGSSNVHDLSGNQREYVEEEEEIEVSAMWFDYSF